MPKSSPSTDPAKPPQDEQARSNDIAARKRKNADAQAAFRARRSTYMASLEETVHNLEDVVLQLQESYREVHAEAAEWKQQCLRTRLEFREREKYWRCLLQQSRKATHGPGDDVPSLPPPGNTPALLQPPNGLGVHAHQIQYGDQKLDYRNDDSCLPAYPASDQSSYTTSPSIPMVEPTDPALSPEDPSGRLPKLGLYDYSVHTASPRDPRWLMHQVPMSGQEGHQPPAQSPVYIQSPSIAATDMSFPSRSLGAPEEDKVQLHAALDTAPYAFSNDERYAHRLAENSVPASRSLSPSTSTPASTVATLGPVYPFTFPDPTARFNDRGEADMRRHSLPHGEEVNMQGGTADLSSLSGLATPDALRYRSGTRESDPGPSSRPLGPTPVCFGGSSSALNGAVENPNSNGGCGSSSSGGGHHDRATSDSSSNGAPLTSRLRRRRGTHPTSSRSPSPGPPSLSCTVAVIKTHAYGALRRTRARGKKSSEGAAKVAIDVLEARGIGIAASTSSKRPRLDNEALAMET